MVKVKVAKAENESSTRSSKRGLYAMVAYYYPQYTLQDAEKLKARDLKLLINTAQRLKAVDYLNFTEIVAAPNSKDGKSIKKLVEKYESIIGNN